MKKEINMFPSRIAILSFLFLFNPNVSIIDVLPDFFGYLLLCYALRRIADLNGSVGRARELFLRMIAIDVAKLLSLTFTFALAFGDEQDTMLLLFAFVFGVLELYTLIPAYKHLFAGLTELGYRYDNVSILGKREGRRSPTDKAARITFAFLIVKTAASVVPELLVLNTQGENAHLHLYDFIGTLRIFFTLICLVLGCIWFFKTSMYFKRIGKDNAFISSLRGAYCENVLPRTSIFIRRAIKLAFVLFGVASLFLFDARLDGQNVFPDVLFSVFMALGVLSLRKYVSNTKKHIVFIAVSGATALVSDIFDAAFLKNYYFGEIVRSEEAYSAHMAMVGSAAVEAIGFFFAIYVLYSILKAIIAMYTGYISLGDDKYSVAKTEALHKELTKKLYVMIACGAVYAVGDAFYSVCGRYVGFAGLISAVLTLVFFISVLYVTYEITDEINTKYMLE